MVATSYSNPRSTSISELPLLCSEQLTLRSLHSWLYPPPWRLCLLSRGIKHRSRAVVYHLQEQLVKQRSFKTQKMRLELAPPPHFLWLFYSSVVCLNRIAHRKWNRGRNVLPKLEQPTVPPIQFPVCNPICSHMVNLHDLLSYRCASCLEQIALITHAGLVLPLLKPIQRDSALSC